MNALKSTVLAAALLAALAGCTEEQRAGNVRAPADTPQDRASDRQPPKYDAASNPENAQGATGSQGSEAAKP